MLYTFIYKYIYIICMNICVELGEMCTMGRTLILGTKLTIMLVGTITLLSYTAFSGIDKVLVKYYNDIGINIGIGIRTQKGQ